MSTSSSSGPWPLLLLAWLVALLSSLSALFIGEVMGQAPCVLCWFQRTFMFPLAVILAIACYRSDFAIWRYALPLAGIGAALAFAHTLLYAGLIPQPIQPCTATGPSCSGAGMTIFGGVPLPMLALFAFVLIAILLLVIRRRTAP
ncbi:disulfide bond formation protein B [Pseudomonas sp. MAP12]|uniref:Disulfide bond formation protein DsbB n=2 Tax=Geopseudomonas TaxID=3236655 RepID=A0A1H2ELG5_9GAMM|nr:MULTISPECIES: disulfide bond formation protein B [Pseudomonas]MBV2133274.1 disulfide bond formation protein B [Pseudomonas aromaticivorans]WGL64598.1 disulfide bond formation protein B [Pseudomonas sp. CW003PS]WPP46123.1 disulfide bond formation protein B [Pseudomonas sp. AN-1]SDT95931.1 disulfide bond formation protein DsbB [Pseudomonas guangdongensis]